MTDEKQVEDLEKRIDELESRIGSMLPSRRDALKLGLVGVAGATAMSGTASAGSGQVGTIGDSNNRVDLFGEDVDVSDTLTVGGQINGADISAAEDGEALTSDGSGGFSFTTVSGDSLGQMSDFLSQSNMSQIAASQSDMQDVINAGLMQNVANSQTAMQEVAASQTAMQLVANSQEAMQAVANSKLAMQEVADSQTAMQAVANSREATDTIGSIGNEHITENTILNSSTATAELVGSNLNQNFNKSYPNSLNKASGRITNERVLVVSNNNSGFSNSNINFDNSVGPVT